MTDRDAQPSLIAPSLRTRAREAVERAWARVLTSGVLPPVPADQPEPPVEITRPDNPEHGDFASNLALKLARPLRRNPMAIAASIADELRRDISPENPIGSVEVAPPGFLNLRLAPAAVFGAVDAALAAGPAFGRVAAPRMAPVVAAPHVPPVVRANSTAPVPAVERAATGAPVPAAPSPVPSAAAPSPGTRPLRVNVEFVSANPTGPLHIGNARGAFVGDLLCRVLEAAGEQVTREYYFNDFGSQVRQLGASVLAIRQGRPIPEDGYRGAYVHDLARELPEEILARAVEAGAGVGTEPSTEVGPEAGAENDAQMGSPKPGAHHDAQMGGAGAGPDASAPGIGPDTSRDAAAVVGRWASERVRQGIEASLARLGVHFDVWTSEGSLYRDGWVARAMQRLQDGGWLYEQDGALWFRSTALGDDKDRVVRRSNGEYTYFGSDIGYLLHKFDRGFDHLVYVWGADHHGTVARVRNAAQALGFDKGAVEMLLIAWVRFVRDGQEISMSKRSGEFITLDELLEEIGVDAARWFIAARGHTSGIDFDIELAKKQSSENPVYYVQYAHARISSILRKAAEAGLSAADGPAGETGLAPAGETGLAPAGALASALGDDTIALGLGKLLLRLPEVVEDAAALHETQGVTAYATELATAFHAFYRDRRVIDPADPVTSRARLALVTATRLALANTLALLGISAPDSM
ncbi:MAG: arginine--tRNA ligase [Candidatus Limnocylindrales bacterium]